MENYEFNSLNIAPLQRKKSCEIKAGLDILRLVSVLGIEKR